jgi:arylsulfatase A-like enzyme
VLVVCGDHGEGFYEHGMAAHANGVFEELMRVPLVVRAPGLAPARDARPAQLLDVPPTLFRLLGLPAHPSFQGEDLLEPRKTPERSRYLLTDTPWSTTLAIVRSGHKLIHDSRLGRCVLYDLGNDPGEQRDVLAGRPDVARDLKARLAAFRRAQLDYYENRYVHEREYPPLLAEDVP